MEAALAEEIRSVSVQTATLQNEVTALLASNEDLRSQNRTLRQDVTTNVASLRQEVTTIVTSSQEQSSSARRLSNDFTSHVSSLQEVQAQITALRDELFAHVASQQDMHSQTTKLRDSLSAHIASQQEHGIVNLRSSVTTTINEHTEFTSVFSSYREQLIQHEEQFQSIETKLMSLHERIEHLSENGGQQTPSKATVPRSSPNLSTAVHGRRKPSALPQYGELGENKEKEQKREPVCGIGGSRKGC